MILPQQERVRKTSLLGSLIFLSIGILGIAAYFREWKDNYTMVTGRQAPKHSNNIPETLLKSQ